MVMCCDGVLTKRAGGSGYLDGAWQILCPDVVGRYRAGTEALSFFVELDRGIYGAWALRAKLEAYSAYRASGAWAQGSLTFPTVLVVTTGEGRLRPLLALNEQVAAARLARPLELLVATREALDRHGVHGPIWRVAVTLPPRRLFSIVPRLPAAPAGRQSGGWDTALARTFLPPDQGCPYTPRPLVAGGPNREAVTHRDSQKDDD